jgi:hypothetical protein
MRELEKEEAAKMEEVRRDLERRMQKVRDEEAKEAAAEADRLAKEREREDRLKDREERLKQREEAIAQRAIEEIRAKEEAERAREIRAQKRLAGESAATESRSGTPEGKASKGKGKKTVPQALATEEIDNNEEEEEENEEDEEPWELACEICKQHGWNVVSIVLFPNSWNSQSTFQNRALRMTVAIYVVVRVAVDGNIPTATTNMTKRRETSGETGTGSPFIAVTAAVERRGSGIQQGKLLNRILRLRPARARSRPHQPSVSVFPSNFRLPPTGRNRDRHHTTTVKSRLWYIPRTRKLAGLDLDCRLRRWPRVQLQALCRRLVLPSRQ